MIVVTTSVARAMNVNIVVRPVGSTESRKPSPPKVAEWIESMTKATMTATAVTVRTPAQK